MASSGQVVVAPKSAADSWSAASVKVLVVCLLAWAFDVYEQTIMQLVTPLLIQEWHVTPTTIGLVTTVSRWIGIWGIFVFPALSDVYGRRPILAGSILGYSLVTGLTGFAQNWQQLLAGTSLSRIALSGESPIGTVLIAETAPVRWRATALGGLVSGYPVGYMLTTLVGLAVVPRFGWRALYWLGILPAALVAFVMWGMNESPHFQMVATRARRHTFRQHFDPLAPVRHYPREMILGTLLYFLYLFTWGGWAAWMPDFLASEKHLGFKMAASYLSIWMFVAIFAYWFCGWLSDRLGRRYVIPAFVMPGAVLLAVLGRQNDPKTLLILGGVVNFLITGSFGSGLGYVSELFPTEIRGRAYGSAALFGGLASSISPTIIGWIATTRSIAAGLPLLALSFFLIGPIFMFAARETVGNELSDFVGQDQPEK